MECDCKVDSTCTATSSYCRDGTDVENPVTGLWLNQIFGLNANTVLSGALTVAGYLLYRFSQALPALIRWPIRLICSLTGLSSLWSGMSRIVGTLRGIQTLFKWSSAIWKFTVALFSKLSSLPVVIKTIAGVLINVKQWLESVNKVQQHIRRPSKDEPPYKDQSPWTSSNPLAQSPSSSTPYSLRESGLRLILLGPSGGGRTSMADSLLGYQAAQAGATIPPLMESTQRRVVVDGREVTVVDTPDLLGPSLEASKRALEALRSLQLTSPGPHAILLVIRSPYSSDGVNQNVAEAIRVTLELYGDGVMSHIITVLTHADCLGQGCTLVRLLEMDTGELRTALSLCSQRAELVDNGPDCLPEERMAMCRRLVERVVEMRALGGHFSHELQRREERVREELLADMASVLARKLGHM